MSKGKFTWSTIELTRVYRLALDTRSPTSSMFTTGDLQEFGSDLVVVLGIFQDLYAALTRVIFRPAVTIQAISSLARMAGL